MVIAVDFDGCICSDNYPQIGYPNWLVIHELQRKRRSGDKIILWTCREGRELAEAIASCLMWGLDFDAINSNLPERIDKYRSDPRKVSADEYWDDRSVRKCYENRIN